MVKKTLLASAAIAALVTIGGAGPGWALPVLEFTLRSLPSHSRLTRPTTNGVFGPNFDIAPVGAAMPEPASLVLLGVGLLGLAGARLVRRREMRNPRFG